VNFSAFFTRSLPEISFSSLALAEAAFDALWTGRDSSPAAFGRRFGASEHLLETPNHCLSFDVFARAARFIAGA
jgi:hypothetical protein